jgi:hypothetical protein
LQLSPAYPKRISKYSDWVINGPHMYKYTAITLKLIFGIFKISHL